jgi:translation initiation factor IF-3
VLETEQAERGLLKMVQHEVFKDEEDVRVRLKTLNTFIDEEGLVRVKTKITWRRRRGRRPRGGGMILHPKSRGV